MTPFQKLALIAGVTISVIIAGMIGFMIIEGWNWLDALYMTLITVTTVGYSEIHSLSPTGRLFNTVLILLGVGCVLSVFGTAWQVVLEGRIRAIIGRKRVERDIRKQKNHYIVCGFGRVGKLICQEIQGENRALVVIENDESLLNRIEEMKFLSIMGDATEESVLRAAGLEQAKGLVCCLSTDADNLYVCLTAREIRPDLFIIARAVEPSAADRLLRAGASRVVSPHYMGARKMAQELLRPGITHFVEIVFQEKDLKFAIEELLVGPDSELYDVSLKDSRIRQELDLIVLGIRKKSGEMMFNPTFDKVIEKGDTLIALGPKESLHMLGEKLGSGG